MPTFLPSNSFTYCTLYGSSTLVMSYDGLPNTATMFGVNSNCITAWWNWPNQSPTQGICNLVGVSIYPYNLTQAKGNYIQSIGNAQNGSIGSTLKSGPIYLTNGGFNDIYFDDPVLTNGFWISIHTSGSDANIGGIIEIRGIWDYDWERSPTSIPFSPPSISVGSCTTFGAHNIQITNKSTVTKQFTFSSNNSDFVPSSGTLTVLAGQTGNKPVQFCPSSAGAKSGTITITCTGSCNPSTATVSVSGTGTAQYNWTLLDDSHNFGDVTVNDYSAWYPTGVKNNSSTTLNFTVTSSNSTNFKVSPSSFTAPPNSWGYFDVRFHPTAQQYYSATMLVTCTTSGANPPEDTMIVSGTGVPIQVYPKIICDSSISGNCVSSHDFGNIDVGASGTRHLYIKNIQTGGTEANCTCSITGTDANQFSVTPTTFTILPDTTESVEILFNPTSLGLKNATITVSCSNCDSDYDNYSMNLKGTGIQTTPYGSITDMTCTLKDVHQDVADVNISVTVQNTGNATGQFKVRIDPDIECEPFDLTANESKIVLFDISIYFDYSPFQILSHVYCYRNNLWEKDDTAECNLVIPYVEGEITMASSTFYALFEPDQQNALIADITLRNSGNTTGLIYTTYMYRTTGEWIALVSYQTNIVAQESVLVHHTANIPTGLLGEAEFGVKVWGETENEPSLPICIPATKENGRYDVDQDGLVTWKDVFLIDDNKTSPTVPYNEYYDMNCDGKVNYYDVLSCNANKDIPATSCEQVPDEPTCTQIGCYWYNGSCHGEPV